MRGPAEQNKDNKEAHMNAIIPFQLGKVGQGLVVKVGDPEFVVGSSCSLQASPERGGGRCLSMPFEIGRSIGRHWSHASV